ncbi:MAG: GNAT family N-acetyltransferase [bacterium]
MNQDELLQLADLNLAESHREISRWNPNTDMAEQGDILFVCGANTFPAVNFAMRVGRRQKLSPEKLISQAKEFFGKRKRSFTIIVRTHIDKDLLDQCKELKLYQISNLPGMFVEGMLEDRPLPDGATLRHVTNEVMVNDFAEVVALSYTALGLPEKVGRSVFSDPSAFLVPHLYGVVAYRDNKPASCALALMSHGIAGIYYVGTIEAARGIGLAEHCTRTVGNAAFKLGARCVILQASLYGEPVYKRMGYKEFTRYPWFVCPSR